MKSACGGNGGSLFFDSLELNRSGSRCATGRRTSCPSSSSAAATRSCPTCPWWRSRTPAFEFQGNLGARMREDYNQTLSDLLRDYHILPAQEWAHSLGLTLRGQAYSSWGPSPLDVMDLYYKQDIAEGEDHSFESEFDLNFLQTRGTDAWRAMSTAVEMAGKKIVSTECCAERPALGYPRQILLSHMNHQFAAGVNQIVYHGWSHKAPKLATTWPGWGGFNYGVSDDYGPHNPTWGSGDDKRINEYVGRAADRPAHRQAAQRHRHLPDRAKGHSAAGQTGRPLHRRPRPRARGLPLRLPEQDPDPPPTAPSCAMGAWTRWRAVQGVRRRQHPQRQQVHRLDRPRLGAAHGSMGHAGLPIFFVGTPPTRAFGNHPEQDAELAKIIAGLLRPGRTSSRSPTQAELPAALRAAGVKPRPLSAHRRR